jgi:hypothetical protein
VQVFFTLGETGFVMTGSTVDDPDRVRSDTPVLLEIIETFRILGS